MYLVDQIKKLKCNKVIIYVDMDGVIADYNVGCAYDFDIKRPLLDSIKKLEEVSKLENTELHILSICKKDCQVEEKNIWLDKYVPFFKKENRHILSKETYKNTESQDLKNNFISKLTRKDQESIVLIDDDPVILKTIRKSNPNVILFKDTVLVD